MPRGKSCAGGRAPWLHFILRQRSGGPRLSMRRTSLRYKCNGRSGIRDGAGRKTLTRRDMAVLARVFGALHLTSEPVYQYYKSKHPHLPTVQIPHSDYSHAGRMDMHRSLDLQRSRFMHVEEPLQSDDTGEEKEENRVSDEEEQEQEEEEENLTSDEDEETRRWRARVESEEAAKKAAKESKLERKKGRAERRKGKPERKAARAARREQNRQKMAKATGNENSQG
jgi:hypothetical protein